MQDYEKRLRDLKAALSRAQLMDRGGKLTEKQIEFFFFAISRQLKQEDRYKEILLSSLVRCVIVNDDSIEIQYNYKKELPTLANPVKVKSSHNVSVVSRSKVCTNLWFTVCPDYFSVVVGRAA